MNSYLKQSTASQTRLIGPFVDDTDFKTAETGLTIANTDVKLSKNGASSVNKNSGGGTHIVNGQYAFTFDATDSNTVGELAVSIVVSGALQVWGTFHVLEEAIYDSLFAASAVGFDANQRVNVGQWLSQAVTLSSNNRPDVNIDEISDDTTAPGNLELMFDGTGYGGGTTKLDVNVVTIAANAITATAINNDAITAAKIAAGAIDAATFAADVDAEILSYIVDDATRVDASALNTLSGHDPGETIMGATDLGTGSGLTSLASATNLATVDTVVDGIKAVTDLLPNAGALTSLATASALATVDGVVDAILVDTAEIGAAGAGLTAVPWNAAWDAEVESEVGDALETTIADSVPSDGTRPSVKQALYMLTQFMLERSVGSTTVTVKKPDGSTTLFTLTLNDGTSPTSITRAS